MKKVILLCGAICSGKTVYARRLRDERNAVILSMDEATCDLIDNEQGARYDALVARLKRYLRGKAVEIVRAGADVILDWGFWTREERGEISEYLRRSNVGYEWHYVDVDADQWRRQLARRNAKVARGEGGSDFYVDAGLAGKLASLFEKPARDEMDVWYVHQDGAFDS